MKKSILFFPVCFFLFCFCNAQEITMYKTFGGARFEMDTVSLSTKQVLEILRTNPGAFEEFRKAKVNDNLAGILGFSGALLVGVPVITALTGGEPEWVLAAGGGALLLASIHFNRVFKARAYHALELYNNRLSIRIKPALYFSGTGVRLVVRF